jgi:hypothetical protein
MSASWFILTKRFGADVRSPSANAIQQAIREVVDPAFAGDVEHTRVSVRFGRDDGPLYVLTYDTSHQLTFEQWVNQDFESPLAPSGFLAHITPPEATRLMECLGRGELETVKQCGGATQGRFL